MINLVHVLMILIFLALIIYACILFTNSVEYCGKKYGMADSAIGGILAAIGTALPETIVPIVAIIGTMFSKTNVSIGEDVALGAVLGSPFLLSTIAFFVTGISIFACSWLKKRTCQLCANPIVLLRDLKYFLISYSIAILCAFIPNKPIKITIAICLIVYYCCYVKRTLKKDFQCECETEKIDNLIFNEFFGKRIKIEEFLMFLQIIFSLALLICSAHFFVNEIIYFSKILHLHPIIMSLLLAPIATELPECFNSIIWTGQSKDTLSISNITGALVFQSCIPAAIGIVFTPWILDSATATSVVLVYSSLSWLYINTLKNKGKINPITLVSCGLFYLFYIFYVLKILI